MNNEIKGISCEVKKCKYHDMSNNCLAGHITVGNQSASTVTETACETFECKDDCECR
ncbi:MAG: DUF1540 domain-containing protein [Eubacterium sp.]